MGNGAMTNSGQNLNILFVVQNDPFYVKEFFDEFLKNSNNLSEIKGVIICSALGKKLAPELIAQMYNFYGLWGFVQMGFRFVGKKMMALLTNRLPFKNSYTLEQLFNRHKLYVEKRDDINSQLFIDEWKRKNIDIIISVASSVIFKTQLLNMPRFGCINIHHGKLPRYRGMMPNFWQMYNNEKTAGITIHRINSKIDDGEIIQQKEIEILPDETLDHLIIRSKRLGAELMIGAINRIKEGSVSCAKNRPQDASYYSFPQKKDVKEFMKRGKRIV